MAQTTNIEFGNDVEQALMTQLMGNAALRTLVEGQIYPSHLSELEQDDITYPCVTFRQSGGARLDWNEAAFRQSYNFQVWSQRSYNEAMRVRDAVRVAFHGKRLTAGNSVLVAKAQNIGQNVLDQSASLYYCAIQVTLITFDVSTPV